MLGEWGPSASLQQGRGLQSGGVPKRKVWGPMKGCFVCAGSEVPEEAPSAPEVVPEEPNTVALMATHQVKGAEVLNPHHKKAIKTKSVPTHTCVQCPAVGGISKAAVRAVVGAEMIPQDPPQVQGVDLGLSGRATLIKWLGTPTPQTSANPIFL